MVSLTSWALSDVGRKRPNNEDSYFNDDQACLFIVADGMGGHRGGERASKLAVDAVSQSFISHPDKQTNTQQVLKDSIQEAALRVFSESQQNAVLHGMGTTLSSLAIINNHAYICHIGDSRIYHIRNNQINLLTSDHSLVNEQVQAGIMRPEEARTSSLRNIITRAIGHSPSVQADNLSLEILPEDIFLLCTDGLNNMMQDEDILKIIINNNYKNIPKKLITESNKTGGDDNITVILVKLNK